MSSEDSRNSSNNGNESTEIPFDNKNVDDATEHIHRTNETNLASLNLKNNNRINMENKLRPPASPYAIIGIIKSLTARRYF